MISRQGQIQIQFNWIFVIIVGSVLLIFFFMLIRNQSDTTEQRIDISQSRYFQTIVSATGQKSGTLKEYKLNDLEVRFSCNLNSQEYSYSVENLPARDTTYEVIFTREVLFADDLQTLTQDWQVPFSAGNFLYITNSKQAFVFYESPTNDYEDLLDSFPKNISLEIINSTNTFEEVAQKNYESITYVFLYGEEPTYSEINNLVSTSTGLFSEEQNKVIVIRKDEDATLFEKGTLYFLSPNDFKTIPLQNTINKERWYDQRNPNEKSSYLGKASLYGSFFSQDKDFYECNMQKAFTRLQLITRLYYYRVDELLKNEDLTSICLDALGVQGEFNPDNPLFPHARLDVMSKDLEQGFNENTVDLVYNHLRQLQNNNKVILGLANCPPLY